MTDLEKLLVDHPPATDLEHTLALEIDRLRLLYDARGRELAAVPAELRGMSPVQRKSFEQSCLGRPLVERAERAEAELERVRAELADFQSVAVETLGATVAKLMPYVQHLSWCRAALRPYVQAPCDCGHDEAVRS